MYICKFPYNLSRNCGNKINLLLWWRLLWSKLLGPLAELNHHFSVVNLVLLWFSFFWQLFHCVHGFTEESRVPGELGGDRQGVTGGAGSDRADMQLSCQVNNLIQHQRLSSPLGPTFLVSTLGRSCIKILHVNSPQLPLDGVLLRNNALADVAHTIKVVSLEKVFSHHWMVLHAGKCR